MTRIEGAVQMHKTLLSSIEKAGGDISSFQWDDLDKPIRDLFLVLGINRIRFIYRKPRGKK